MEKFLLYGGIVFMAFALIGAVVTIVVSQITKRRLQAQYDQEFGKEQDG